MARELPDRFRYSLVALIVFVNVAGVVLWLGSDWYSQHTSRAEADRIFNEGLLDYRTSMDAKTPAERNRLHDRSTEKFKTCLEIYNRLHERDPKNTELQKRKLDAMMFVYDRTRHWRMIFTK